MVERIKRKKSSYLPLLDNSSPTGSPTGKGQDSAGDQKKTEREETIESIINAFSLPHRNEFYII